MAEAILSKALECGICKRKISIPRALPCQHTFCQFCLDDTVIFKSDGSGHIKCPVGDCQKAAYIIEASETVYSKLPINYAVENMIEMTKELENKSNCSKCQDGVNCIAAAGLSCQSCSRTICDDCFNKHTCENKNVIPVVFVRKYDSFQPVCKDHNSLATSVCLDCDVLFVCVYCINRSHKHHKHDTVENQGSIARTVFATELNRLKNESPEQSAINYEHELKRIPLIREELLEELVNRKLKRVHQCIVKVDGENDQVLSEFDRVAMHYESDVKALGLVEANFSKTVSKYSEKVDAKKHFELVYQRDEILQTAKSLSLPRYFTTKLGKDGETSVGLLECKLFTEKEPEDDNEIIKLSYDKTYCGDSIKKGEELNKCVNSTKDLDESIQKKDALANLIGNLKTQYTYKEVCDFIQRDKNDVLKYLLKHRPHVVHLLECGTDQFRRSYFDDRRSTLYHMCATHGKSEALSMLLQTSCEHINDIDDSTGYTALMLAARNGHLTCLEILLQYKAEVNIKDNEGRTALDWARKCNRQECVNALQKR